MSVIQINVYSFIHGFRIRKNEGGIFSIVKYIWSSNQKVLDLALWKVIYLPEFSLYASQIEFIISKEVQIFNLHVTNIIPNIMFKIYKLNYNIRF